jgi:hypothetical protein
MDTIFVSFVHGYNDVDLEIAGPDYPALWVVEKSGSCVLSYPMPRNVSDFRDIHRELIVGDMPEGDVPDFKRLPRFGFCGLSLTADKLFAASYNGVYELELPDCRLARIVSNRMMNDLHGIWVDEDQIITILTGKDTVVISDRDGKVVEHFTIGRDLRVYTDPVIETIDWRFVTKQYNGPCGNWHFNYVQKVGEEIWLTSRNTGAFVVVDLSRRVAELRTVSHNTTVLLHDGWRDDDGSYYFTSIDGKIIIARSVDEHKIVEGKELADARLFSRDLVTELIRLNDTEYGREPNWCRGIARSNGTIYVTIDGRYGEDLSFGLLGIEPNGKLVSERRLRWRDIGDESLIRYVTGFDIEIRKSADSAGAGWDAPPLVSQG